ncbi:MAG TPA: HNH endonuclease family protein [Verrucomicrobiae bacterium]|jgi:hypothetical protein|nr:HNH endonuclease family protein [Verrucomicrobiae bacterium]
MKDEYWIQRFTPEQHQQWLNKLGNITLLCGKKNSKAQYFAFPKKKEIYLKRNEKVSFDMMKEICNEAEWKIEQIETRQKRFLEVAEKLWKIE